MWHDFVHVEVNLLEAQSAQDSDPDLAGSNPITGEIISCDLHIPLGCADSS